MIHRSITAAAARFSGKSCRFPTSLEELVAAGIIQRVPEPPTGTRCCLDATSMQVLVLPQ